MKVIKSKRSGNTVALEIEVTHQEIESKMDGAFKKVSKNASVPGFRKGKVPRQVFEKEYGKQGIIQESIFDVVNDTYKDAIEELSLKVIDYPKDVDIDEYKEEKPIRYRCNVDVEPEIKLKKYKGLKVSFEEKTASNEDIQNELDRMVDLYSTYESVERESKNDDIVRYNATTTIDDTVFELWTRENQATRLGLANYGQSFDEQLTGLQTGDKKSFELTYESDFKIPEVAGKTVSFDIEVTEIREKTKPELTDELAKKIDKDCASVSALTEKISTDLNKKYEQENKTKKEELIFDSLITENDFEVPSKMVEQEINMSFNQFQYSLSQQGLNMKQYLDITKKSEEDIKSDLKEPSEKRVKIRLVMEEVIKKEKFEVTDEEIEAEIQTWNHEKIKTLDDLIQSKEYDLTILKNNLIDQKARDFLISSAKIK